MVVTFGVKNTPRKLSSGQFWVSSWKLDVVLALSKIDAMRPYYPKMNIAFFMQGTVYIRLAVIDNFATTRDMFILTYPASFPYWIFSSPGNSFKIQAKYFQPECSIGIFWNREVERKSH